MSTSPPDPPFAEVAATFYGPRSKKRNLAIKRSLENQSKRLKEEKLPDAYHSRILGPSARWQIFYRQQEALDFAFNKAEDLHVFAFECQKPDKGTGQRQFLVATYPVFWHYYLQLQNDQRHHYEVIPEGCPCKLYFDLEFHRPANPCAYGAVMVDILIKYVCCWLKELYGVQCCRQDVLELTASTETKFSRHLIFQGKDTVFKDNIAEGHFIRAIFDKLKDHLLQEGSENTTENHDIRPQSAESHTLKEDASELSHDKPPVQYSGIKGSDHMTGSENELEGSISEKQKAENVTRKEKEDMKAHVNRLCHTVFRQFEADELKSLFVRDKDSRDTCFADLGVYTKNCNFRLYKSCKLGKATAFTVSEQNSYNVAESDKKDKTVFLSSLITNISDGGRRLTFENHLNGSQRLHKDRNFCMTSKQSSGVRTEGYGKSPYPEIDDFITSQVSEQGGAIRQWSYFPKAEILHYDIAGYRFCYNVQRQHHSNNIKLIADLQKGVWYQKCYDPDCQAVNFKSEDFRLPCHILPSNYFVDDFEDLSENDVNEDDAACLLALQTVEEQMTPADNAC